MWFENHIENNFSSKLHKKLDIICQIYILFSVLTRTFFIQIFYF